ncbi:MAG: hypothetical protein ACREJG_03730 [Candidatus Rokuibacteriota bacterium]
MRRLGAGVLLTAVLALAPLAASAGMADRVGATFAVIAEELIEAFQPVEGLVVAVDGGSMFLDLGEEAGVQPGQELTVFRRGEVFRHSFTGKALGRYEEVLGHAQITRVEPKFSEAAFVPLGDRPAPRPEDGVRITRGPIKVAITPPLDLGTGDGDLRRVPYLIATVLDRSRRFQVVDPLAVADMFVDGSVRVEEVLARPERAVRIAKNLDVAGWLVPIVLERRGVLYLDVTWISAVTGTPLFSRRQALLPASAAEEQRFPWEPRIED